MLFQIEFNKILERCFINNSAMGHFVNKSNREAEDQLFHRETKGGLTTEDESLPGSI